MPRGFGSSRFSLLGWRRRRNGLPVRPLVHLLPLVGNLHLGAELLIVLVLDDFADVHVAGGKMQNVVGASEGRKPIKPVNLLPPSRELGEKILAALLADVRHRLAVSLHDLKVVVVHPDASLEIALLA